MGKLRPTGLTEWHTKQKKNILYKMKAIAFMLGISKLERCTSRLLFLKYLVNLPNMVNLQKIFLVGICGHNTQSGLC